jgi:hypothetical protein
MTDRAMNDEGQDIYVDPIEAAWAEVKRAVVQYGDARGNEAALAARSEPRGEGLDSASWRRGYETARDELRASEPRGEGLREALTWEDRLGALLAKDPEAFDVVSAEGYRLGYAAALAATPPERQETT